jgi:hypothetical protein
MVLIMLLHGFGEKSTRKGLDDFGFLAWYHEHSIDVFVDTLQASLVGLSA